VYVCVQKQSPGKPLSRLFNVAVSVPSRNVVSSPCIFPAEMPLTDACNSVARGDACAGGRFKSLHTPRLIAKSRVMGVVIIVWFTKSVCECVRDRECSIVGADTLPTLPPSPSPFVCVCVCKCVCECVCVCKCV